MDAKLDGETLDPNGFPLWDLAGTPATNSTGNVTRGKRVGVNFIIRMV